MGEEKKEKKKKKKKVIDMKKELPIQQEKVNKTITRLTRMHTKLDKLHSKAEGEQRKKLKVLANAIGKALGAIENGRD